MLKLNSLFAVSVYFGLTPYSVRRKLQNFFPPSKKKVEIKSIKFCKKFLGASMRKPLQEKKTSFRFGGIIIWKRSGRYRNPRVGATNKPIVIIRKRKSR